MAKRPAPLTPQQIADAKAEAREQFERAKRLAFIRREMAAVGEARRALGVAGRSIGAVDAAASPSGEVLRQAFTLVIHEYWRLEGEAALLLALPRAAEDEDLRKVERRVLRERGASSYQAVRAAGAHDDASSSAALPEADTRAEQRAADRQRGEIDARMAMLKRKRKTALISDAESRLWTLALGSSESDFLRDRLAALDSQLRQLAKVRTALEGHRKPRRRR